MINELHHINNVLGGEKIIPVKQCVFFYRDREKAMEMVNSSSSLSLQFPSSKNWGAMVVFFTAAIPHR